MQINMAVRTACGVTALATVFAGCAMFEPKGEPNVAQPVGSTWVRGFKNTGTYGSGNTQMTYTRAAERVWQGRRVFPVEQSNQQTLLQAPNSSWVAIVKGDQPLVSFDPPAGYDWPLKVGKTFTQKFNVIIHATKRTFPVEQQITVEAYEDVVVPAGRFKAFRVKTIDSSGIENTSWFSSELGIFVKQHITRAAKHPSGAGTQESELVSQNIKK